MILTTNGSLNSFSAGIFKSLRLLLIPALILTLIQCGGPAFPHLQPRSGQSWLLLGGDPGRSHFSPVALSTPLKLAWHHKITAAVGRTLLYQDGLLFVPTFNGKIDVLVLRDGQRRSKFKLSRSTVGGIALEGSRAVVLRRNSHPAVQAVDLISGNELWKSRGEVVFSEPLIVGGDLYIAYYGGSLVCHDLESGVVRYKIDLPTRLESSPSFASGLVILGGDDGVVRAYRDEKKEWEFKTDGAIKAAPACRDGRVYLGTADERFYCLDASNGKPVWSFAADGKIMNEAAIDGQRVCFGTTRGTLFCLDAESGKELWRSSAKSVISTAPLITRNAVFFGSLDKHIYAVDVQSGKHLWSFETEGRILTHPIAVDNSLVIASQPENVYCFTGAD
ncbi:PQQ-like beta-propeller repeat protein [candidate division KSB1 bacterium]|nr:PQQ-like beta-propeller repeat protein [candidate division KSB1 bacterium]